MELKYVSARDKDTKKCTMLLYGEIGVKIDGDQFAQELNWLSKEYDEITIRINSPGGSVFQGLSIFNAILNSSAYTIAHIEGVAASIAGVIPMASDKVIMNDFARIMVHNPFYTGKKAVSNKEQKALDHLADMLNTLLSRRGVDKDKMTDFMAKETWFKADEAKDLKLVDEVINTGKADMVNNALTGIAALSSTHFENFIQKPQIQIKNMELIASLFGLQATATEAEIITKINALQAENNTLKTKVTEVEALVTTLKTEKEAARKQEIEALAAKGIETGHFKADQKAALIEMGMKSPDTFKAMIDGLTPVQASLSAVISASAGASGDDAKKDFEWYRHNDPLALAEMKVADKAQFDKLYTAWEKANA